MKYFLSFVLVSLLVVLIAMAVFEWIPQDGPIEETPIEDENDQEVIVVTSYEECVAAGFPIMESFPEQCNANGQSFTRDVGNTVEMMDIIRLTTPSAGDTVTSPITLTGEARGTYYFEASFPVDIEDTDGNVIGQGYVTATEDWMTEEFVPFEGTLEFEAPTGATMVYLVAKKDNPSGLPENDAELRIPLNL